MKILRHTLNEAIFIIKFNNLLPIFELIRVV